MSNPQNEEKEESLSELSLKRDLAKSGYSKMIAKKVWKWYNPPESNTTKP